MKKDQDQYISPAVPTPEAALAQYVFEQAKGSLTEGQSLIQVLESLIPLSRSALYKKIAGEVPLSAEELIVLVRHFNISLDRFVYGQRGRYVFMYPQLSFPVHSVEAYLQRAEASILSRADTPDMSLCIAMSEPTIFQYGYFPELTAIRMLAWGRSSLPTPELESPDIRIEYIVRKKDWFEKINTILNGYQQVPSQECISPLLLDNILGYIEAFYEQGLFETTETMKLIGRQMMQMIDHMIAMSTAGVKFPYGTNPDTDKNAPFKLYLDEAFRSNTQILTRMGDKFEFSVMYEAPHFMITADPELCTYFVQWFERRKQVVLSIDSPDMPEVIALRQHYQAKIDNLWIQLGIE